MSLTHEEQNEITLKTVPGIKYFPDFITEAEEKALWDRLMPFVAPREEPTKRRKIHATGPFSEDLKHKVKEYLGYLPERVFVNFYEPGDINNPHIDNVMNCEDALCVLSLGDGGMVEFAKIGNEEEKYRFWIAPRSLYLMSGDSRYHWTHSLPLPAPKERMSLVFTYGGSLVGKIILDSEKEHDWVKLATECQTVFGMSLPVFSQVIDLGAWDNIRHIPELMELKRARVYTTEETKRLVEALYPVYELITAAGGPQNVDKAKFNEVWSKIISREDLFYPGQYRQYDEHLKAVSAASTTA